MGKFCKRCGSVINPDGSCPNCTIYEIPYDAGTTRLTPPTPTPTPIPRPPKQPKLGGLFHKLGGWFRRVGIENTYTGGDPYERDLAIVPDCVMPVNGEVPRRQFRLGVLRTPSCGKRAELRMQITNRRILFRMAGRQWMQGNILQQYECDLAEFGGAEIRGGRRFCPLHLWLGLMIAPAVGALVWQLLLVLFLRTGDLSWLTDGNIGHHILFFLLGVGGMVPFMLVRRNWFWKIAGLSLGACSFATCRALCNPNLLEWQGIDDTPLIFCWRLLMLVLMLVCGVMALFSLYFFLFVPDFSVRIRTKTGETALDLSHRTGKWCFAEAIATEELEGAAQALRKIVN